MKVAILGYGGMGAAVRDHLKQFELVSQIVVYDRASERVRAGVERHGLQGVERLEDALADPAVQLAFVTASNDAHKSLTLAALRAGKAVMCEKPMAATLEDAREMVEESERRNGFLQIGFELRYSKLYAQVKEWIEAGLLGEIVNTHCWYICGEFHGKASWRIRRDSGGMFGEKLCHYVDLPRWWIGAAVVDVYSACAPNIVPYFEVRDNFHTTYRFDNGAVSHLTFMMGPAATFQGDPLQNVVSQQQDDGHALRFLVVGTKGAAETDVFHRRIKRWVFGDSPSRQTSALVEHLTWDPKDDSLYFHNTRDQARDVVRRVAQGLPPKTSARDSFETMRLCFAAEQSADHGGIVRLDPLP